MELVEGRVRLTFDLGSGALILTSNKKYNTGVWFKITLQRNKRKGSTTTVLLIQNKSRTVDFTVNMVRSSTAITEFGFLISLLVCSGYLSIMAADQSSEKEVLEAESPGMASDLNRSDLDPIYIGGLPVSRPIR